jgi:peptidoglycan/xylan/chitin deacetylase (PgdA/CDA1 family)
MTVVPVLMYHSVSDHGPKRYRPYVVSPDSFAEQMAYLDHHGFRVLRVRDFARALHTGQGVGECTVVLTFDDGLADFASGALPVLDRFGFRATLFIVTGCVGGTSRWERRAEGRRPMLRWEQIRELAAAGIECGAHTSTHPELDVISPRSAKAEIFGSKQVLEEQLSTDVSSFAYPHGCFDARVRALVKEAGYTSACASKNALSSTEDDPYALARVTVTPDLDLETFGRVVHGRALRPAASGERLRTRLYRVARRFKAAARPRAAEGLA